MSETPAATIRRAAALMRERAEAATRGPWWSDESEDCWRLHGVAGRIPAHDPIPAQVVNKQIIKAPKHGTPYAEYWPDAADDAFITSWHPPVALAVADWLDSAGAYAERTEAEGAHIHPDSHALKVAIAYLGETPPADDEAGIEAVKRAGRDAWEKYHGGAP